MSATTSSSLTSNGRGEFTMEAKFVKKDDGQWYLQFAPIGEATLFASKEWIAEPANRWIGTGLSPEQQTVVKRGEPLLLMCVQKAVTQGGKGNSMRKGPTSPTETIVLWIDEVP